jgi:hypothetical protein
MSEWSHGVRPSDGVDHCFFALEKKEIGRVSTSDQEVMGQGFVTLNVGIGDINRAIVGDR